MTNFPDHVTARDLWNVCNDYGVVVDASIPTRNQKQVLSSLILDDSVSSGDEEDAKDDGSQSGDKVTTDNDVERVLMISNNVYFIASFIPYYCSEDQYAVSIKEDTAYLCLHSPKTTKETRSNTPYPGKAIRRIQAI
ncbi:hypothetical protein Tco_0006052 [Tanacetum coccineum]